MHCTHGVNRTGYLICRYLIQKLKWSPQKAVQGSPRLSLLQGRATQFLSRVRAMSRPRLRQGQLPPGPAAGKLETVVFAPSSRRGKSIQKRPPFQSRLDWGTTVQATVQANRCFADYHGYRQEYHSGGAHSASGGNHHHGGERWREHRHDRSESYRGASYRAESYRGGFKSDTFAFDSGRQAPYERTRQDFWARPDAGHQRPNRAHRQSEYYY